ncbi:hypothetical protein [Kocuria rosea]|uniref:hypothetical protein n=1 Tax=Kocuria rosea TaxID=1275 RepID=UPI0025B772C8|nr:hypothetical protein [Kocuria rosea]WJZ68446.1 hypothetical protein QR564_17875 [Kocuria rosea]
MKVLTLPRRPPSDGIDQLLPNARSLKSWPDIHAAVEQQHGYKISVGPAPQSLGRSVTGVWMRTETQSYIFHDEGCVQSEAFVRHIVAHEYGHILLRHSGCALSIGTAFSKVGKDKSVQQILARSERWTSQEKNAEAIAVALAAHLASQPDPVLELFG